MGLERVIYIVYYEKKYIKGVFIILKEKFENDKNYVVEHKKQISCVITVGIIGGVIGYKHYNNIIKLKEIAKRSLDRELNRNNMEIKKLENSIARLKPSNININYRIPERIKRIEELKLYNEEILKDKNSL